MNKDPDFIFYTTHPDNAEPPLEKLQEDFITPVEKFYIRNHGEVPDIDPEKFCLRVTGLVERELNLSFENLKKDFPKYTVMATLECAGNRRTELISIGPILGEVPWREGVIGNATWSGVRLKDVLNAAGIKRGALYVEFMGAEDVFRYGENVGFGASIPIEKGMTDEVLLAYEMNGAPLQPTHGFPLRVIVPGYIGARSVKWLVNIRVQETPSKNYFQDHAYRLFPPEARPETVDWNSGLQLSEIGLNCVITYPKNDCVLFSESLSVKGFAIGAGGKEIERVEISIDGGRTWIDATISEGREPWSWSFWEAKLQLKAGEYEIIARAFDVAGNMQPEDPKQVWNFKGYMNNAWHRVKVRVVGELNS